MYIPGKAMEKRTLGVWWNDHDVVIVEIDGMAIALDGWNGEFFLDCWECIGDHMMDVGATNLEVAPLSHELEDGDFEIYDYVFRNSEEYNDYVNSKEEIL